MTSLSALLARTHARALKYDRPWTAAEFAPLLASNGSLLTGDAQSFVLGRVTLDEAEILTLATDPAHQRHGLARARLSDFIGRARELGAERLFLDVAEDNLAALTLYDAAGFTRIAVRKAYFARPDGAVAAIVMERRC